MTHRTIILPFTEYDENARLLLYTASLWKAGVQRILDGIKEHGEAEFSQPLKTFKTRYYRFAYTIIPDKYYSESCAELVYEIGSSLAKLRELWRERFGRELEASIYDVKLGDWIMFESRGDKRAKGNLNIRLVDLEHVNIKVFMPDGGKTRIELLVGKPKSKRFRDILEETVELASKKRVAYNARVYIRDASEDVVKGEVQVAVPYEIYARHYPKLFGDKYEPRFVLGFDVNFDRVNAVLIDVYRRIAHMERLDLTRFVTQGRRWKDARTYTVQWLYKLFNYVATEHGEFAVAAEDPDVLGLLKLRWVVLGRRLGSGYNYRVARFTSTLVEAILDTSWKLGIQTFTVNPAGTSSSHEHHTAMARLGLDRHMASAYIVAIRAVEKLRKRIGGNIRKY